MGRPRTFDKQVLVETAKGVFWANGFEPTSVDDLQEATSLSRSSLYLAFPSKRELFDTAFSDHLATFVDPLLAPLEDATSGIAEVIGYFRGLSRLFSGRDGARGCLMVNTIAELGGRDSAFTPLGAALVERHRRAFGGALKRAADDGVIARADVRPRAAVLVAAALGAWIEVRVDPDGAADAARAIAREIGAWGTSARR